MKRLITLACAIALTFGLAVSAQAVNLDFSGGTANSVFGKVPGVQFVNDQKTVAGILKNNASTYFDLVLIGKSSDYQSSLGKGGYFNFKKFNYSDNFDKTTGAYLGQGPIREDVLLADVSFEIKSGGKRYVYGIDEWQVRYPNGPKEYLYDTNYYGSVSQGKKNDVWPKLQLFVVTDDMVEINGSVFYKGSLIFCLDDGDRTHIDFNDLVFALAAKTPPVVPIPGAALLMLPGLAGLAVLRKKLK